MKIIKSAAEMKNLSLTFQKSGKTIGLIPTMGALHKGHLSLLEAAQEKCDLTVMSIFVNPVQFGPQEDYQKYPRPFDEDCRKAQMSGCDIVFAPSIEDMYPTYYCTYVSLEGITDRLCGAARPGHFRGVATVVLKLFNIVMPQIAVFGAKDAQQVIVIKRMVRDLNLSVRLEVAPIMREEDGLAMSSRNVYLTEAERKKAPLIFSGLKKTSDFFSNGERNALKLQEIIRTEYQGALPLVYPEYIEIVDLNELKPLEKISEAALIAVACRTKESKTRLIDNIVVGGVL